VQDPSVRVLVDDDPAAVEDAAARGAIAGPSGSVVGEQVALAVTLQAMEANEGDLLMLRAAAVADPETGRCVVLVGPTGSGRSTAARTLARHFGYVTDDTVAFTATLDLLPYPKPLVAGDDPAQGVLSPDDLGLRQAPGDLRPAAVLLLEHHAEGFVPPVLTPLPTAEAIAHLSGNASYLRSLDKPLHRLAALVEEVGGVHRVDYREADDLVAVTQQLLNHPQSRDAEVDSEPEPTVVELLGPDTTDGGERVRRLDFVDFHVSDGIGSVMLGETVVALSFLATRIVTLLGEESASLDRLAEALLVEFGEPESGDARSLVQTHVDDLVEVGVLTRV
jgi:energy-coupling factor transporter ATP-binding protein EcfA2